MLAYAANRPRIGARQSSPNLLLLVICTHIILVALVLSTKMALPPRVANSPIPIIRVNLPKPPPPNPVTNAPRTERPQPLSNEPQQGPAVSPTASPVEVPLGSGNGAVAPIMGGGGLAIPNLPTFPSQPLPINSGAELVTPSSDLKPPYPEAKLLTGEEAALTLRLSIDEHGRVIAVDPVGSADPVFLAAARKHLLAHWRYKPAMKNGRPVASTSLITLRFQLDG